MPACVDQQLLLGGLVDGELDAANIAMVEAHVGRCEGCREELERLNALRGLLGTDGVRHAAPAGLARRLAAIPELSPRATRLPGWLAPGLAGALAASLATAVLLPLAVPAPIDRELVSGHIRSLQPGHLIDIQTSNRHVVKPWFNGRVDFSPPVPELAAQGFPLAGGRLDSIDGKTAAVIVYHRRLHAVNLFVWPASDAAARSFVESGFSVEEWSRDGLRFAAVSDIPAAEVRDFRRLYQGRAG